MKTIVAAFLVIVAGLAIMGALARRDLAKADARATELRAERDSILFLADRRQAEADSAKAAADSLDALRIAERAAARERMRILSERADSLVGAIGALMPPNVVQIEIREAVLDAVQDLRATYEMRIADLENVLALTDSTLARVREQAEIQERIAFDLRAALANAESETELWKAAADRGFLDRLKSDLPKEAAAFAIGWFIGGR